jgi:hypothetical protein
MLRLEREEIMEGGFLISHAEGHAGPRIASPQLSNHAII